MSCAAGVFLTTAGGTLVQRSWDGEQWSWQVLPQPKPGEGLAARC